jgi:hypothetical protein
LFHFLFFFFLLMTLFTRARVHGALGIIPKLVVITIFFSFFVVALYGSSRHNHFDTALNKGEMINTQGKYLRGSRILLKKLSNYDHNHILWSDCLLPIYMCKEFHTNCKKH